MRFFVCYLLALGLSASAFSPSGALACSTGQYSNSIFCVPTLRTLGNDINPLPDLKTIADGISEGDEDKIYQGVGGLILKQAGGALPTLLSPKDRAFVKTVIGRGTFVFLNTGDPVVVVTDGVSNIPHYYSLTHPANGPTATSGGPPIKARAPRTYYANNAECAVSYKDKAVIGWIDAPYFVDDDGNLFQFPSVDLRSGDTLNIDSRDVDCGLPVASEQVAHKQIAITYSGYQVIPIPNASAMKWYFSGAVVQGDKLGGQPDTRAKEMWAAIKCKSDYQGSLIYSMENGSLSNPLDLHQAFDQTASPVSRPIMEMTDGKDLTIKSAVPFVYIEVHNDDGKLKIGGTKDDENNVLPIKFDDIIDVPDDQPDDKLIVDIQTTRSAMYKKIEMRPGARGGQSIWIVEDVCRK